MSETAIQTAIQEALKRLPWVRMYRNKQAGRGRLKAGLGTGTSDLVGWVTRLDGVAVFFALEVKRDAKADATDAQREFIADVIAAGGVGEIVWSVEQAVNAAKWARRGAKSETEADARGKCAEWREVLG